LPTIRLWQGIQARSRFSIKRCRKSGHRIQIGVNRLARNTQRCLLIATSNPQFDRFRLVLVAPSTRHIFAEKSQRALHLPRISIPRWTRAAEQVQAAIERKWEFKAIVLDVLADCPGGEDMVIAELRNGDSTHRFPHPHSWVGLSDIREDEISGSARTTVERLLNDGATGGGTFSRFGWVDDALDWISTEAGIDRPEFTGNVKQFNASASFALARFDRKAAPPLWFKAAGDPAIPEYRITTALSKLFPDYLPTLVSSREDWNAWWMEDAGRSLDEARSADMFGQAVSRLAELQKASICHVPALVAAGCGDQRTSVLRAHIPEMMEHIEEAMARPSVSHAPRLGSTRIREMGAIVEDACLNLEGLGIPDTLLHGDINFGNILAGPRGCVFTDWAHAAIGHPFVMFEHLRAQFAQETDTAPWLARLTEIYRESWREMLTGAQIECALAQVPPIAIVLYLFERWNWLASERRHDPQFQSYLRGLARQLDRAAQALGLGSVLCA
jgi:hypothetical protein